VIVEGPLAEWEAVVDSRISGKARVRVLLELLGGRRVPLELPVSQVYPLRRT
jgi:transcription antitermination factor NusG